ncbi:MAG: transposase [Candidatus Poribacteria bacterium]|nr:transposase [Candidatus Poribacteria bacterium]
MNTLPKYRSQDLRKGRASIPGAYYHIIICTHQRRQILADDKVASIIFKTFDWLEAENRLEWICIMVMPDHVHTVIKLGEEQTLSKVLHSMKRFTAREINKHLSGNGPLWQKGYTDCGIRTETTLNNTIRYCYVNPLRKGLVKAAGDYPYWRCKFDMGF